MARPAEVHKAPQTSASTGSQEEPGLKQTGPGWQSWLRRGADYWPRAEGWHQGGEGRPHHLTLRSRQEGCCSHLGKGSSNPLQVKRARGTSSEAFSETGAVGDSKSVTFHGWKKPACVCERFWILSWTRALKADSGEAPGRGHCVWRLLS